MSDGTEVLLHLLAGHADTVIGNGQCARRLIRGQMNGKIAAAQADGVVRQGLIGQLVDGIGGVGDQLAQEDLAVCIDRIDHQVQQAFRFCLKLFLFHMDQLPYFVLALLVPEC